MAGDELDLNRQQKLTEAVARASYAGFVIHWTGGRVLYRLEIPNPDGNGNLIEADVVYMRDGLMIGVDRRVLGSYERTVDGLKDGEYHNEIIFSPSDDKTLLRDLQAKRSEVGRRR